MTSTDTGEQRIAALEARLRQLEDERDITRLIATYGPLVDAGAAAEVAALWTDDGIYDVDEVYLNGHPTERLPGNLNISFAYVEGESLLMGLKDVALSSGSACTSASLEPSYVLKALGVGDDLAHSSIRYGIGRFNTEEEVDFVADLTVSTVNRLREMSPLYELAKEGVDLKTVQWAVDSH